jgi:hypothetical protein
MMMVKKPKTHRAPHHAHDEPDEDFEDEPVAEAAVHPEAETATAVKAKASHAHDGSTGHPAMVLPAAQIPQTHTQQTLSPSTVMGEVVRKFLWTAQSG